MYWFDLYYRNTKNCHVGAGWDKCGKEVYWKKWKCAEFKSQYYVELIDNPTCLQ